MPGFLAFPAQTPAASTAKPGSGQTLTAMANIYSAIPPGPERNAWWRGLNDRLGVDLQMQMVPNAEYQQKFSTMIAGNDLPDVMQIWPVANMPQLMQSRFARLDDFIGGDQVLQYPNLANIATVQWRQGLYGDGLYGVPIPRGRVRHYNCVRADLIKKAGMSVEPESWAEFLETAKAVTDPKQRRWAIGLARQTYYHLARMNSEPNVWQEVGGRLTHAYETEQFKQSVADMTELWKAGVLHPDAFNTTLPLKELFNSGSIVMNLCDGYGAWTQYVADNADKPDFEMGLMPAPLRDGGGPAPWHLGTGIFNISGISKSAGKEKTELALRVLDWLAAPFGTAEHLYRTYGDAPADHTRDAHGDPVVTKEGQTNTALPIKYLADAPAVLHQPGRPEDVRYQHAFQTKALANGLDNPTYGLYSATATSQGGAAESTLLAVRDDVVQGRKSMADLDAAVAQWRTVGDKMRAEFEAELQKGTGR